MGLIHAGIDSFLCGKALWILTLIRIGDRLMQLILKNDWSIPLGGGKHFEYYVPTPHLLKIIAKVFIFNSASKHLIDHYLAKNSKSDKGECSVLFGHSALFTLVFANGIVDDCIDEAYGPYQKNLSKAVEKYHLDQIKNEKSNLGLN